MPYPKESQIVGVKECKISELTTDVAGSELVYGSSVAIPGIKSIKTNKKIKEAENRGDEVILGIYRKVDSVEFSFDHVKVSLDALAIMEGGAVASYGTTPNQKNELIETGNDVGKYFRLEARCLKGEEVTDAHITLFKCKANVDIEFKGEDYAIVSVKGTAIPAQGKHTVNSVVYNQPLRKITFNETMASCI